MKTFTWTDEFGQIHIIEQNESSRLKTWKKLEKKLKTKKINFFSGETAWFVHKDMMHYQVKGD